MNSVSLTLPLVGEKDDEGGTSGSVNSTPASDTFYTATSVLTPDPRDLTSPLSPLPLDTPHSGLGKGNESLASGTRGAFVDDRQDDVPKVPTGDAGESNLSYFEKDDDDELCTSVYKSPPRTSNRDGVPRKGNTHHPQEVASKLVNNNDLEGTSPGLDIGALLTSPILVANDVCKPQGSPAVDTEATSTPIRSGDQQVSRNNLCAVKAYFHEDMKPTSLSTPVTTADAGCGEANSSNSNLAKANVFSSVDNGNCESHNNNVSGNGNEDNDIIGAYEAELVPVRKIKSKSVGDSGMTSDVSKASLAWYSGLDVRERSALISPHDDLTKANEVLMRLREESRESNVSIQEKVGKQHTCLSGFCCSSLFLMVKWVQYKSFCDVLSKHWLDQVS